MVAAHWTDVVTDSAGVCVATVGAAPSRRFVVEWPGVRYFNDSGGARVTFEIVLEETTGVINLLYPTLAARQATAGVENFDGSDGVSLCSPPGAPCPLTSGSRVRLTPRP